MLRKPADAKWFVLKTLGLAWLTGVVLSSACNGGNSTAAGPTAPTPTAAGLPVPLPTGDASGRIESLDTAADLITYNQAANIGFSIPVEGAIQRSPGILTRWELPIPVYVAPSISGNCAEEALAYWQSVTGLPFVFSAQKPSRESRCVLPDQMN